MAIMGNSSCGNEKRGHTFPVRSLVIPGHIFEEMVSHCRAGYPEEACGILAGKEGEVSKIYRMTNIERSPVSYFMDPKEQFSVMKDMRENGLSMVAIFHSHPSSAAYPSARDVSLAFYDDCLYVIVGLAESLPAVKAFSIKEGRIEETDILVK